MPEGAKEVYDRRASDMPPGDQAGADTAAATPTQTDDLQDESWVLQKTHHIYRTSTDYLETNVTNTWERALAHFRNQHANGSRYKGAGYRRSAIFRPKTRATLKSHEAALASALFSTLDIVDVQAQHTKNVDARIGAELSREIMRHRLTHTIPWFLTLIGGWQDTEVYGIAISHIYWDYRAARELKPELNPDGTPVLVDDGAGNMVPAGRESVRVDADRPCIDLVEPENFRFDPMCDWRDPAGTSSFLIYMKPMSVGDVEDMMDQGHWKPYERSQILTSRAQLTDRTRQAREGTKRIDPAQTQTGNEFTTVWAHLNIMRHRGVDYCWWSLGTTLLLTMPTPLVQEYPHLPAGKRPFEVGFSSVEAHRNYPDGSATQGAPLQEELNDIVNQRLDNVRLALNKRYHIRRGSQVDLEALMRNVPGGGVMMNDTENDVKVVQTPDVTASSYQEQDRLSNEFDELLGGFSQSSVVSNRKINETVGGMDRIAGAAATVHDYGINVFKETFVEPTLRQLHKLLAMYETDEVVLGVAKEKSKLYQQYGVNKDLDYLLQHDLVVRINLGIGNSDPQRRVERLVFAVSNAVGLPGMAERLKPVEISNMIFGALGFKDATPFFMDDEEFAEAQQNAGPQEPPPEIAVKMRELDIREADNAARHEREMAKLRQVLEIEIAKLAEQNDKRLDEMAAKLGIAQMQNKTQRDTVALTEANKLSEMNLKQATGEGI